MTTEIWFEIWNMTATPYKVNPTKPWYDSEMEAELAIPMLDKPQPDESADTYEIRQIVMTTSVVNTFTVEPRAIKSVEEIADDAISEAIGLTWFRLSEVEDYNLLSKEDQEKVAELFDKGTDCCNTCGMYVSLDELDEEGDCDDCHYQREVDEEEDLENDY